jgi:hypothetical protein
MCWEGNEWHKPHCNASGFHATGDIDSVSKHVVHVLILANDSCHKSSCVEPDPDLEWNGCLFVFFFQVPQDCKRELGNTFAMIGYNIWNATNNLHHTSIAMSILSSCSFVRQRMEKWTRGNIHNIIDAFCLSHTMYASPIVLIFSTPYSSASESIMENNRLSIATSGTGSIVDDIEVNPTMSEKKTVADSDHSSQRRRMD